MNFEHISRFPHTRLANTLGVFDYIISDLRDVKDVYTIVSHSVKRLSQKAENENETG